MTQTNGNDSMTEYEETHHCGLDAGADTPAPGSPPHPVSISESGPSCKVFPNKVAKEKSCTCCSEIFSETKQSLTRKYPGMCKDCNRKQVRRDEKKRYRSKPEVKAKKNARNVKSRSKKRDAKRNWLQNTERCCPRCEETKTEWDFRWDKKTKFFDVCIACRAKIAGNKAKRIRAKLTGRDSSRSAERELVEKRQKPSWASGNVIRAIYSYARTLRETGFDCHVDHIIPLRGELVSGLHVESNLRVLCAKENIRKSNKVEVDPMIIPSEVCNYGFQDFYSLCC